MSEVPYFLESVFFVSGLLLGSFANVLIHRIPLGESVAIPRSRCVSCKYGIPWYLNIPLFSYLILVGKCKNCGARISVRYPVVELIMGLLFVGTYLRFGLSFEMFEILLLVFGLIVVSFIDLKHMILPDVFTLSGIVIGFAGSFLSQDRTWLDSLLGIFLGGGLLWLLAYLYVLIKKQEGMGGGDVKLLAWIGAVLGFKALPFIVLVASITGSFVGLIAASQSKDGLRTAIPFGPFLSFGAILYLFYGDLLSNWYLSMIFPMN